jgi:hypothetical protein
LQVRKNVINESAIHNHGILEIGNWFNDFNVW